MLRAKVSNKYFQAAAALYDVDSRLPVIIPADNDMHGLCMGIT